MDKKKLSGISAVRTDGDIRLANPLENPTEVCKKDFPCLRQRSVVGNPSVFSGFLKL